ncbi:MAG: hypothetical protein HYV63_19840 [Candidatus Schekmanbacteria bacterium]|nr:hypothetical protein [Candidatus Schekmanbacteria bacterium]
MLGAGSGGHHAVQSTQAQEEAHEPYTAGADLFEGDVRRGHESVDEGQSLRRLEEFLCARIGIEIPLAGESVLQRRTRHPAAPPEPSLRELGSSSFKSDEIPYCGNSIPPPACGGGREGAPATDARPTPFCRSL